MTLAVVLTAAAGLGQEPEPVPYPREQIYHFRQLGDQAFQDGRYQEAGNYYLKYREMGRPDKAISIDAVQCLVAAAVRARLPDQAQHYLDELIGAYPELAAEPRLKLYQADIFLTAGKFAEAEKIYRTLLPQLGGHQALYYHGLNGLGFALVNQQQWDEALKIYSELQGVGQGSELAFTALKKKILALIEKKDLNQARETLANLTNSWRKTYPQETALMELYFLLSSGREGEALARYSDLRKNRPNQPHYLWYRTAALLAETLLGKGQDVAALTPLTDLQALAPDAETRKRAMMMLINTLVKTGEKDRAAGVAGKYLDYYGEDPLSGPLRLQLARLLSETGKTGPALAVYAELTASNAEKKTKLTAAAEAAGLLMKEGLYPEADKNFNYLITAGEDAVTRGEGSFGLALILFHQGQYQAAAAKFEALAGENQEWRQKALAQAINSSYLMKNYDQAIRLGKSYLAAAPSGPEAGEIVFQTAMACKGKGDLKTAALELAEFIKNFPQHPLVARAWLETGNIAFEQCDFARAERIFSEMITKYPADKYTPDAVYKRIYSRYFEGKNEGAIADTELLAKNFPDSRYTMHALFWLVDYYREKNLFDQAENMLAEIHEKYREEEDVAAKTLYERAYVCNRARQTKKALFYLNELKERFPDHAIVTEGLFLQGDILSDKGSHQKALAYFEKAAERRPGSALATACWGRIGDCHFSLYPEAFDKKVLVKAAEHYEKVLAQKDLPVLFRHQTLYKLGKSWELLGEKEKAVSKFKELIYSYKIDNDSGEEVKPLWMVKGALAAAALQLEKNQPEAARDAIGIYQLLLDAKIEPAEDFNQKIKQIREKYHL